MLKKFCFVLAIILMVPQCCFALGICAKSAIVMDAGSNSVLYDNNSNEQCPIASTTKIMTSLLACESGKLCNTVNITTQMVDVIGSSLGIKAGDKITLYDLVVGMLLVSGNDAANSVAYYLSGSTENFAKLMNKRAAEIGMNNTKFVTPSGLDQNNNHSTAYDMALLTCNALQNKNFAEICKMQKATIKINDKDIVVYNHNRLLNEIDGCVGVKTGYTDAAGRCLVSAVTKNDTTMICVTLNDYDDWNDHKKLIKECEKKYKTITISENVLIPVVGASKNAVCCKYECKITALTDDYLVKEYYYPFVYAPVKKGDVLGYAKINNKTVPIKSGESINYGKSE